MHYLSATTAHAVQPHSFYTPQANGLGVVFGPQRIVDFTNLKEWGATVSKEIESWGIASSETGDPTKKALKWLGENQTIVLAGIGVLAVLAFTGGRRR